MNPCTIRPPFLATLLLSIFIWDFNAPSAKQSEWVYHGPDGKLVYKTTPSGDRIMDFSSAGYMGGGVALPANVPVKRTVEPSRTGDDTARIQAALNEVAAMPMRGNFRGVVLLAPGTFVCSNTIYIPTNGIVLRGSGSRAGGSTIEMRGGRHVAIASGAGRRRFRTTLDEEEDLPEPGQSTGNGRTFIADTYVPSGTAAFTVADAKGFAAGDTIEIRRPVTPAWVK